MAIHDLAPGVSSGDRRRLDFVVHGAAAMGEALCCDATVVSPLTREGTPAHAAHRTDGAALTEAENIAATRSCSAQGLVVLACETGGRWSEACRVFLRPDGAAAGDPS